MRYSVVDIGSNTVKIYVYDTVEENPSEFKQLLFDSRTVGLMAYIKDGVMQTEGALRLSEVLSGYKKLSDSLGCDRFFAFATAALRSITNAPEVCDIVYESSGCKIDIIDGDVEAGLSFDGLCRTIGEGLERGIMIDMGGGSTEIIGFTDSIPRQAVSFKFGCLSLFRDNVELFTPTEIETENIKKSVFEKLSGEDWISNYGDIAYFVGGSGRAIGMLDAAIRGLAFVPNRHRMTSEDFIELERRFRSPGTAEIRMMIKAFPDRIHTFLPALAAYSEIISKAKIKNIIICSSGIREGYLARRLSEDKELINI